MSETIDLGSGFTAYWIGWHPDRELNPQYADIPDIEKALLMVTCCHGHKAGLHPDTPEVRRIHPQGPHWKVVSWEPLHLEPSISSRSHDCHGFIRGGKWVWA